MTWVSDYKSKMELDDRVVKNREKEKQGVEDNGQEKLVK